MSLKIRKEKHRNILYIIGSRFTVGIYQHKNGTHTNFLINSEDFPEVAKYTWGYSKDYFYTYIDKTHKFLHELVMNLHGQYKTNRLEDIDHISLVKTDCRYENLRIVSKKDNSKNRHWKSSSSTGYRGVFYEDEGIRSSKNSPPFRTTIISKEGKNLVTGRYATLEEAVMARIDGYEMEHNFILDFPNELLGTQEEFKVKKKGDKDGTTNQVF